MEVKQGSGDDSSEGSKSTEPAGAGSETDRSYGYGDPSDEAVQETTTDYRLLPLLPELEHRRKCQRADENSEFLPQYVASI